MNKELDKLVANGTIISYSINTEEFEPGSGNRETDKLTITFPNGSVLVVDTFCSGSSQNTSLLIEVR